MSNHRDPSPGESPSRAKVWFRRFQYSSAAKTFRAPLLWWRHVGLRDQDVFLGCYPRSGGTWLRFTLFEILTGKSSNFENVNRAFRGLSDHRHGWPLLPGGGHFIGTHEPYRSDYRRAVYLVRDVRDVALSEFAFEKNLGVRGPDFDEYLQDMLLGRKRYGSWQDHAGSWLDSPTAKNGSLLLIKYEDLRRDSVEMFLKLVGFLGVAVERGAVEKALANNAIDKMREKEDSLYAQTNYSSVPRRPEPGVEPGGRFVRSGKVGGWREQLTPEQLRLIEQHCADVLRRLAYPVVTLDAAGKAGSEDASAVPQPG